MDDFSFLDAPEQRARQARRDQSQRDLLAEYEAETDPYLRDVLASEIEYEQGLSRKEVL